MRILLERFQSTVSRLNIQPTYFKLMCFVSYVFSVFETL